MKILVLIALIFLSLPHRAFSDVCAAVASDPDELSQRLKDISVSRTPVRYFDAARRIEVVTRIANEGVMVPSAASVQGRKVIYFPPQFATLLCNVVVAEYLTIQNKQADFLDRASGDAATCLNTGGTQRMCLLRFAVDLSIQARKAIAALPAQEQRPTIDQALAFYDAALHQIVMHEYAHLLLNHLDRLQSHQMERIDAEFEADIFAILNGMQVGEPPSAMVYFFDPMASVERRTTKLTTPDYEPSACRANNAVNITNVTGTIPILLIDASFGGKYLLARNSPAFVRSSGKAHFDKPLTLTPDPCGKIADVPLKTAFDELRQVYSRMDKDLDLLFTLANKDTKTDTTRLASLTTDLGTMSTNLRYMNSLTAKSLALILRQWGLNGHDLTPLIGSPDTLFSTSEMTDNFISIDFGRLLQAQGLAILQERTDLAPRPRLDQATSYLRRAVFYNPWQSEAWSNLAMIAFKRGDCVSAAGYWERAAATLNDTQTSSIEDAKAMAAAMKKLSADPRACAAQAATFHPYPNL